MSTAFADPVLLHIRGTLKDGKDVEAARKTHNATAGNDAGVAAAKALGDLSHKVFIPAKSELSGNKPGEFLILDVWQTPDGIQKFFSDKNVQEGGKHLFAGRNPTVFMRAQGAYTFNLPAAMNRTERYVGLIRAKVKSPRDAIEVFGQTVHATVNQARQRGQLSHDLYFQLAQPSEDGSEELLGVDVWTDLKGMETHYRETMEPLRKVFAAAPDASIWMQPPGSWVEW